MTHFFPVSIIAQAAGKSANTIHRQAVRKSWPKQVFGNAFEFSPPRSLRGKCRRIAARSHRAPHGLTTSARLGAIRAQFRFAALLELDRLTSTGCGIEKALQQVAKLFYFHCSPAQLRVWQSRFADGGLSGLLEHKAGRSGRKPGRKKRHG